jgi:hypothetical protein
MALAGKNCLKNGGKKASPIGTFAGVVIDTGFKTRRPVVLIFIH